MTYLRTLTAAIGLLVVADAHAAVVGAAGEALLVPLVVWADTPATDPRVNTVVEINVPATVGWDDVANIYSAPHTSPTNPSLAPTPHDADLEGGNAIHWYWFDHRSVHRLNRRVPVSANDLVQINWHEAAGSAFNGEPGYMVIGTELARSGAGADFALYGNAYLLIEAGVAVPEHTYAVSVPVLPLTDAADGAADSPPSAQDNVKYSLGIPRAVSPLISGMRTTYADGSLEDITVFDLALSTRVAPTIHIVWLDENPAPTPDRAFTVGVDVFDDEEHLCSSAADLPNELNVIWIPPVLPNPPVAGFPPPPFDALANVPRWATGSTSLCLPFAQPPQDPTVKAGFARYQLAEYKDRGSLTAENAGVAFSIKYDRVPFSGANLPNRVDWATAFGHEQGNYK